MSTCAVLFAKKPESGKVKTRLESELGPEAAARLYRAFLLDCATELAASQAAIKVIAYAPAKAVGVMRDLLAEVGEFAYVAQPETDLGGRMEALMQWGFATGNDRVVLLGSDSPSLPTEYIDLAFELLCEREVVLGPSTDGGYYLVGQRAGASQIFSDVAWSTGAVLAQTLERLKGQSLGLLPPWYDVDTPAEVGWLKVHLEAIVQAGGGIGKHSLEVMRDMALPLPS